MKKIWFLLLLATLALNETHAQIKTDKPKTDKSKDTTPVKINTTLRNAVVPRTPQPTVNNTPATAIPSNPTPVTYTPPPPPTDKTIYYLRTAKVDFVTGNDNKELQSKCDIMLICPGGSPFQTEQNNDPSSLLFSFLTSDKNRQEFRPNTTTRVDVPCLYQFPGPYEGWRYYELLMSRIQTYGLKLSIYYSPNFILDAWKIEKVIVTLEFGDAAGKPHPSMSTVTIPFNASVLLNNRTRFLTCEMDKFLMPTRFYTTDMK